MCGIFGFITKENSGVRPQTFHAAVNDLFKLSESRGKEAAGIALRTDEAIKVLKQPVTASMMMRSQEYKNLFAFSSHVSRYAVIGHSRLVTSGAQAVHQNNQPVIKNGIVGIHNGIITNCPQIWQEAVDIGKEYEVDTEALLGLIKHYQQKSLSLQEALKKSYRQMEGSASIAFFVNDLDNLILATNNGSLYLCRNTDGTVAAFASERYMLAQWTGRSYIKSILGEFYIEQLKSGQGAFLRLDDLNLKKFSLTENDFETDTDSFSGSPLQIIDVTSPQEDTGSHRKKEDFSIPAFAVEGYEQWTQRVEHFQRCQKCILPENFPFIQFDEQGVCNYCHHYKKVKVSGRDTLEKMLAPYRSKSGEPDCLVAFSGGRDSSYGLHYLKTEMKMNPVAYTYDWGMITDLARNNQARICGKLGIEHILVSADINWKRGNIRRNVNAWFKKPHLGMIPLFMAGDKQYFYHANQVKKQVGVELIVVCNNKMEESKFKAGFSGVYEGDKYWYDIAWGWRLKLALFYFKQFMGNPVYLNRSLWDSFFGYISSYMISHDYLWLYDYIPWDGDEIINTLKREYHWEVAQDTESTWRIGDGTAAFYNYLYYMIAGFTENDTFRSTQVREGIMTREQALKSAKFDNQPRYHSIKWYCDTIGIDYLETLKKIHAVPKHI